MSILDEILERELRKILPQPKTKSTVASEPVNPNGVIKSCTLKYQSGTSDKVYHVQLVQVIGPGYAVQFQYGRRGKTLIEGTKTPNAFVSMSPGLRAYDELVGSKLAKGYEYYT